MAFQVCFVGQTVRTLSCVHRTWKTLCLQGRYLRGPSQSLVQMTDANAVDKLCDALRANKQFMLSYKSGYKLSLLRQYARYCRENQTALADGPQPAAAASGGVPVGRLREESISHTDNRINK